MGGICRPIHILAIEFVLQNWCEHRISKYDKKSTSKWLSLKLGEEKENQSFAAELWRIESDQYRRDHFIGIQLWWLFWLFFLCCQKDCALDSLDKLKNCQLVFFEKKIILSIKIASKLSRNGYNKCTLSLRHSLSMPIFFWFYSHLELSNQNNFFKHSKQHTGSKIILFL